MSLFVGDDDDDIHTDGNVVINDGGIVVELKDDAEEENNVIENGDVQVSNDNDTGKDTEKEIDDDIIHEVIHETINEIGLNLTFKYQREIVDDLLSKDGLLILGRGLGWELIVANILYILNLSNMKDKLPNPPSNRKSLLIVLNANEVENVKLQKELRNLGTEMIMITGESTVADKRRQIYDEGGIVSVTSRILVVDLLSEILLPEEVNGFFILHSERIKETSNESFIVNLYRDRNQWGCIKAFSDDPESFTGFTPLATRLKNLKLSTTFLWPRFHVSVSESLSFRHKKYSRDLKTVNEYKIKLTYKMVRIQSAIITCLTECLKELTRHNQTLATEYWDMENIYDVDFVQRIRLSLESQWHRVSITTKLLISDLSFLKGLLNSLLTKDCVTFYQIVQSAVDNNIRPSKSLHISSMSPWLNSDVAPTIISFARERALGIHNNEYVLESLPKWDELETLLKDLGPNNDNKILIMTSNESKEIIDNFIHNFKTSGKFFIRRFLARRINSYIAWKEISKFSRQLSNAVNDEQDEAINVSKTFVRDREVHSKRRRTRGAASVSNVDRLYAANGDRNPEAADIDEELLNKIDDDIEITGVYPANFEPSEGGFIKSEVKKEFDDDLSIIEERRYNIVVESYGTNDEPFLLDTHKPTHIILYEPDLSFIRRIENYQGLNEKNPAIIYMLYYGDSTDEHEYLTHMKKEKESFTRLIREKANLSKHFETKEDTKFKITKNNVVNTRIAGGQHFQTEDDEFRVIVDVREFRSSLPNLLYRVGCKVLPCMLTVGDYILTPKICVERKAIPDLISSFKSGRLYNQCEQMFRHYEIPVLLIEFDENKSFSFEPFNEHRHQRNMKPITSKFLQDDLQSKLSMLLVSFPKLKIIWSSSPYETSQIFVELKSGELPPDVSSAIRKGLDPNENPSLVNEEALDILTSIPGVNNSNVYRLMNSVKNIEEFVDLPKTKLIELMGVENGTKAYNFINHKIGIQFIPDT
ncbi:DNA repair protein Rad1p [[Candida] jaroonii]|uniref:DNA repair protein Rad1p n=1 Tax=[Candida] jaroonii TaxID=467808 RepID=A0ACA9YAP2_9ASCO|nr:DNA repair protein Rad1p [[Candida] jaroonii]